MTATLELTCSSVLTTAWVRTSCLHVAESILVKEKPQVTDRVDANLADVRAAARGDGDAYARVVRRYQDHIARRMMRFSRDARIIEELVHDVFVEAYFALKGYRGGAPFEHWLQRIATRVGYRFWTRQGADRIHEPIHAYQPEAATRDDSLDDQEEVAVALQMLPPRDRLVLTLLYLESRSVAEAADLAGWSESMVKVQAHRARQKLRRLLERSRLAVAKENEDG